MEDNKFSLNAGELSDEMAGRIDLSKVQMGLSVAENVRILRVGGVTRRAGLGYVANAISNGAGESRLEGFRFAEEQGFCFEFGSGYMKVYQNGAAINRTSTDADAGIVITGGITGFAGFMYLEKDGTFGGRNNYTNSDGDYVRYDAGRWEIFKFPASYSVASAGAETYPWLATWTTETVSKNNVFVVATPWTQSQVFGLQFAQRIDGIVVTHPDMPVQFITRDSTSVWSIAELPWQERVWETATDEVISLTPSALTGVITVTASASIFASSWVGSRLRLAHPKAEQPFRNTFDDAVGGSVASNLAASNHLVGAIIHRTANTYTRTTGKYGSVPVVGTSSDNRSYWTCIVNYTAGSHYTGSINPDDYPTFFTQGAVGVVEQEVKGNWSFETFGTWRGTYIVERRYNAGAWNAVKIAQSNNDKNYLVNDTEDKEAGAEFRVLVLDSHTSDATDKYEFIVSSYTEYGFGKITGYTSPTVVTVTIEEALGSTTSTNEWYEDAFNPRNGYPKACTFHQRRLFLAGTALRPQYIWSSRTAQPFDFTQGTLAEDGLSFETEAKEYESVLWLNSHLTLLIGTTAGVWSISSPNGLSITAENNALTRQVKLGGFLGVPAVSIQNNVLFLQSKGRKIHELTGGSVEYGGYTDVDLTQLASHITRDGVTQITVGQVPDSMLYMVVGNELAILTYERAQNVVGWARWVTDGVIESVAVCDGGGEDDDIYLCVKRGSKRFIERLAPDMLRVEEDNNMDDLIFLDSHIIKENVTPFTSVTGLDHLEGLTVQAFGDGEKLASYVVTGGAITLSYAVNRVVVGLPYDSIVTTMPLDRGTIARKTSVTTAHIRFRNSLGMKVSQDGGNFSKVDMKYPLVTGGDPLPLVSGDAEVTLHSSWARSPVISIKQSDPLPMTVLAIRINSKTSQ